VPDERIIQGGRAKAYRPIPEPDRQQALRDGLDAYERGDFFLAHELLEPAWMGTADISERELLQGLIKLAAAFVHGARGNVAGIAKNLRGARARLENGIEAADRLGMHGEGLIAAIDERLAGEIRLEDAAIVIPWRFSGPISELPGSELPG
jgi:predicted metal-dependent hydrolase